MTRDDITVDELRELLNYDPETGLFRWRVDAYDERFGGRYGGTVAGTITPKGYRRISIGRAQYMAHRLAWLYVTGRWLAKFLDHENTNKDDNRFSNLREASRSNNGANRGANRNNKTGLKGVSFNESAGKYAAQIRDGKKYKHLGYFDDPEDAHKRYVKAAVEIYGEFARAA